MHLKGGHPFDGQTRTEGGDVKNIVEEAEDERFDNPLKFRLLHLCTQGARDARTYESGKKDQQRNQSLQSLRHALLSSLRRRRRNLDRCRRTIVHWRGRLIPRLAKIAPRSDLAHAIFAHCPILAPHYISGRSRSPPPVRQQIRQSLRLLSLGIIEFPEA